MKKAALVLIILAIVLADAGIYIAASYFAYLRKAHSTFENYYAFRGCVELIEKTDTYGICKISSGQIIKLVKHNDKWYLDGDLPCGFLCF